MVTAHDHHQDHCQNGCPTDMKVAASWAFFIFLGSSVATVLPFLIPQKLLQTISEWLMVLATGMLLGTCFFHLTPELLEHYLNDSDDDNYDIILSACVAIMIGILVGLLTEQLVIASLAKSPKPEVGGCCQGHELQEKDKNQEAFLSPQDSTNSSAGSSKKKPTKLQCVLMILALSIHGLFEGMALTLQAHEMEKASKLGFSLLCHKCAVGIAMGLQVNCSEIQSKKFSLLLLQLWALVSPFGGVCAMILCKNMSDQMDSGLINGLNAFALGTFLYCIFFCMAPHSFDEEAPKSGQKRFRKVYKVLVLIAGCCLMYAVTKMMPHEHSHCHESSIGDSHHEGHDHDGHDHESHNHEGHSHEEHE